MITLQVCRISYVYVGIVKTHNLGFQESEAVQAVFNKDLSPNHIAGPARYMHTQLMYLCISGCMRYACGGAN